MDSNIPLRLPLLLDGATGSILISRGLPSGVCPEEWILQNPDVLIELYREFTEAGSDIIYAPTFSANRIKLSHFGLEDHVTDFNTMLVGLTKHAVCTKAEIAGVISSTGELCEPFGILSFTEMIDIFTEQAKALAEAGVNLFVIEDMLSLPEIRAAVIACKKLRLPIFVTVTVDEHGKTLTDSTALSCLICLQGMGIAAFGLKGSHGAECMAETISELVRCSRIPIIAKPNAGRPDKEGNYDLSPDKMAEDILPLLKNGAQIAGGGSTPQHIKAIRKVIDDFDFSSATDYEKEDTTLILSNEAQVFYLEADGLDCSEPLLCSIDMADELLELSETNIDVITIELVTPDDAYLFSQNAHMSRLPIMFRSNNENALRAALLCYHGRAMIDKSCDIPLEALFKISDKYGAVLY